MSRIFTTTLRLDLDDEDDRRAWERLRGLDRKQYRSYSKAIVAAINDYFERQERLDADPYLETREKEDAFLQRIMETVESGLRAMSFSFPPAMTAPIVAPLTQEPEPDSEDMDAALDFADSF